MRSTEHLEKCLNLAKKIDLKMLEKCAAHVEGATIFLTQDGFDQPLRPAIPVLTEFQAELWQRVAFGNLSQAVAEKMSAAVNEWRDAYLEEIQTEAI
jgi:hypothetical protein